MAHPVGEEEVVGVTVLNLAGVTQASVQCTSSSTVRALKVAVAENGGPPVIMQTLTCEDGRLKDDETVHSLGWKGDVTVYMLIEKELNLEKNIEALEPKGDRYFSRSPQGGAHVDLPEAELSTLCELCCKIFLSEPPLLEVPSPVVVLGALSGNLLQLREIFAMCGPLSKTRYICLGHYADRGECGIETLSLLLHYKCKCPESLIMLRGKHECASISRIYGLYDECRRRYNVKLWKSFVRVFNTMPWACVVQSRILCVHSGISLSLPRSFHCSFSRPPRGTSSGDDGDGAQRQAQRLVGRRGSRWELVRTRSGGRLLAGEPVGDGGEERHSGPGL
ncbi:unnamed protein product [Durusdinium trenchii]|uniref:protein-serine/threonine phosphatase n=1 Tax=Durusdinium trenchii TaxID=1381693 RepID=A0ABP0NRM5_9DINO